MLITAVASRAANRTPRLQRTSRWFLVVVLGVHTLVGLNQAVLSGAYLDGSLDAMRWHGVLGGLLMVVVMAQGVAALMFWLLGRGPWWPFAVTVVLLPLEGMQIGFGYGRQLGLHVPLGVAIILIAGLMTTAVRRWRPAGRSEVPR